MVMFILMKDGELMHAVSRVKKERLKAEGWELLVSLTGFNISIDYQGKSKARS